MLNRRIKISLGGLVILAVLAWALWAPGNPGGRGSGKAGNSEPPGARFSQPLDESRFPEARLDDSKELASGSPERGWLAPKADPGPAQPAQIPNPLDLKRDAPRIFSSTLSELRERILYSGDREEKIEAVLEIASFWPEPEARETLLQALQDPEAAVRMEALQAFHIVKDQEAVPAIREISEQDPSPEVRERGVDLLEYLEFWAETDQAAP